MLRARRSLSPTILAALLSLSMLAAARPALAFKTGPSPAYPGCKIWFNDQGQPLRTKQNRPIGEESPCGDRPSHEDFFKVVPGLQQGTLAIKDDTHHLICILKLAPGSTTLIVPEACERIAQ